jgi:hypothetical protein
MTRRSRLSLASIVLFGGINLGLPTQASAAKANCGIGDTGRYTCCTNNHCTADDGYAGVIATIFSNGAVIGTLCVNPNECDGYTIP